MDVKIKSTLKFRLPRLGPSSQTPLENASARKYLTFVERSARTVGPPSKNFRRARPSVLAASSG